MSKGLFQDSSLNELISKNGYVTFPFLNKTEIEQLNEFYETNNSNKSLTGFHATMFDSDNSFKEKVDSTIKTAFSSSLQKIFSLEYSMLYTNFLVKEPGLESNMKWHQDWAFVDENNHTSYAIWVPLIDLNENNGAFTVAKGSHKLDNLVRGPGVEDSFISAEWIEKKYETKPLYLKAGEAVVWHHRLLHASPPNNSEKSRLAATAILVPNNSQNVHYYKVPKESFVREYLVDKSFFIGNDITKLPNAPLIKKFFYEFNPQMNTQQITACNLKSRIKKIFSI